MCLSGRHGELLVKGCVCLSGRHGELLVKGCVCVCVPVRTPWRVVSEGVCVCVCELLVKGCVCVSVSC